MSDEQFEPKIVGFLCNWCSYRAADLAGSARIHHATNVRIVRVMCSGRVDPTFVLKALSLGADGVMIAGCHPGECHYTEQNMKALRRFILLRRTIEQFGIEPQRLKLVWASAAEGTQLAQSITEMVAEIKALGPLNWPIRWSRSCRFRRLAISVNSVRASASLKGICHCCSLVKIFDSSRSRHRSR